MIFGQKVIGEHETVDPEIQITDKKAVCTVNILGSGKSYRN